MKQIFNSWLKQGFLAILFLSFFTQITAQTKQVITYYDYYKLHPKEVYTVLTTPPFLKHGTYKVFNEDGTLFRSATFFKNELNGTFIEYYTDDHSKFLHYVINYKMGKRNGSSKDYDYNDANVNYVLHDNIYVNGELIKENTFFASGKILSTKTETSYTEWNETGEIIVSNKFKDGHPIGRVIEYYDNEKIKSDILYTNNGNIKYSIKYNEEGTRDTSEYLILIDSSDINDLIYFRKDYYQHNELHTKSNGRLSDIGFKQDGLVITYKDGKIDHIFEKKNDVLQGIDKIFYLNGNVQQEGTNCAGHPCGDWKWYNETGTLTGVHKY